MRLIVCGGGQTPAPAVLRALEAANTKRKVVALLVGAGAPAAALEWAAANEVAVELIFPGQLRQAVPSADGVLILPGLSAADRLMLKLADDAWIAMWQPYGF